METLKKSSKRVLYTLPNFKLTAVMLLCFCDVTFVGSENSELSQTNLFQWQKISSIIKAILRVQEESAQGPEFEESSEKATELLDKAKEKKEIEHKIEIRLGLQTKDSDVELESNLGIHASDSNIDIHKGEINFEADERLKKYVTGKELEQGVKVDADVEGEVMQSDGGNKLKDIKSITTEGTEYDEVEMWHGKEQDDIIGVEKDIKKTEGERFTIRINPRDEEGYTLIHGFPGMGGTEFVGITNHKNLYKFDKLPWPSWCRFIPLRDCMSHESPPQVEIQENTEKEILELETNSSRNDDIESEEGGPSGEQALCESSPCSSRTMNNESKPLGLPEEQTMKTPGGNGEDLKLDNSSTDSSYQSNGVSTLASYEHLFPNTSETTRNSTLIKTTTIPSISFPSSISSVSVFPTIRWCGPPGHFFKNNEINVTCNSSSILTQTTVQGDIESVFFVRRGSKVILKEEEWLLEVPSDEYCLDDTGDTDNFTAYYCTLPTILFQLDCGRYSGSPCARKCCPHGEIMKENECVSLREEDGMIKRGKSLWQHTELVPIPGLPVCQQPLPQARKHIPKEDGTLQMPKYSYPFQNYCVEYVLDQASDKLDQQVFICEESFPALLTKNYFIVIGLLISCVFLAATLFFHAAIPELRNLQGLTLMSYVASLLMADATLLATKIYALHIARATCIAIAFVLQLSFLASFFWLNVMCFDIWCYVGKTIQMVPMTTNMRDAEEDHVRYIRYALYAWGTPVVIVAITSAFTTAINSTFRQGVCWFHGDEVKLVFFYAPSGILFIANLVLILHTVVRLYRSGDAVRSLLTRTQSATPSKIQYYNRAHLREFWYRFSFYSIMAMCWAAEVLSWWLVTPKEVWNITDILNTLQGLFVFVIFMANKQKRVFLLKYCDSENPARACFCRRGHSKMEPIDRFQTTVNSISKGIPSSMPTCTPKMPTTPLSTILSKTGKLVLSPEVLTKKRSSSLLNLTDSLKDATTTGRGGEDSITCQSMKKTFPQDLEKNVVGDFFYAKM
ncbi:uncharacterized protein LOC143022433 [Oratosquilla oratoria]|uniref:uncharacterized protein LOC143022433 n=1 Tax=Oratosquilla oratoria TaxID=337810 RepID=UPI003F75A4A1